MKQIKAEPTHCIVAGKIIELEKLRWWRFCERENVLMETKIYII